MADARRGDTSGLASDPTTKREVYDVVVIGGGGSGLAAAIEAASTRSARVALIEKAPALGGSTGKSIGSITASQTPDQAKAGIQDTPDDHLEDYLTIAGKFRDREDPVLARLLVDNVTETLAWLRSLGLEFFGPMHELPHRKPRMHNVLPTSRAYIYHLSRRAAERGVDIRLGTRAESLTVEDGRVTGVVTTDKQGARWILQAQRGVILAGGDFANSVPMRKEFISDEVAGYAALNQDATGDTHRMARELGAEIVNGDVFEAPSLRFAPPLSQGFYGLLRRLPPAKALTVPIKWALHNLPPRAIRPFALGFVTTYLSPELSLFENGATVVDRHGDAFLRDDEPVRQGIARLGGEGAYLLGDARIFEMYSSFPNYVSTAPGVSFAYMPDFRRTRKDIFFEGSSWDEVAAKVGMTPKRLKRTVGRHNEVLRTEKPGSPGLGETPFFAMGPLHAWLLITCGGCRISPRMEVLRPDDTPVPGLFAAGSVGQGGLLLLGHGHHLGWAFTSGRLAGRSAAANPP